MSCEPTSTADIPRGCKALPPPVAEALRVFLRVCAENKVPMARALESPDAQRLRDTIEKLASYEQVVEKQKKLIDRQHQIIADLEKRCGAEDEL